MARGVQRSVETKIAEIEAKKSEFQTKIDSYKTKIADLDSKIKELEESQKHEKLQSLLQIIEKSGKTPEEVMAALNLDQK